jgi:hypothetical protein
VVVLSWAQAVEVAKRLDPPAGRVLVFSSDGSVLYEGDAQREVAQGNGEVYACRRDPDNGQVLVARVPLADVEERRDPAFGTPW